jgi:hypothetical protein
MMHRLNPRYIRIAAIVLLSLIVVFLIGGYIAYTKRGALLQREISKAEIKAKNKYNLNVKIGSARFTGLATVAFSNITIVPDNRDSLLSIQQFEVSVKIFPLLFGAIKLADVNLQNAHLNLTSINGIKNFDFLFKKKRDSTENNSKGSLAELANNLINQVLYKIPDNLGVKNFLITLAIDSTRLKLLTQTANINDGKLTSTILVDNGAATWHFAGTMHPSDKDIDVRLYADSKKVELPIIEKKFKLKVNFDTITTRLTTVKYEDGETKIYGSWSVRNLLINHPGISSNDIVIPSGSIDANVFVGQNYVSLDSSSVIHLKKITAHPYIKYTLKPVKVYTLKLNTGWLNAQDIFDSFPTGIFDALDGIQVAGKLNYSLNFNLDTSKPDDVVFDSRLDKNNFGIVKYGKTDLTRLNSSFVYTPYEKGKPMPSRIIGSQNPDFTPLDQMSSFLRNAVMTAEDPTFFKNRGFVEESIRKSIATDFKEKKFKRGGSTISMQLVKNSFLSREKTLTRKIEEILIVWMIENNNIMTKNRILEVYFNIIEWGPNVYGIGEAARYYFDKTPAELNLGESIYLASIVPKPKAGLYAFLPDGSLRPGLVNYFNSLGRLMANQYLVLKDTSTAYGFYDVHLKESMRRQVAPVDSAAADKMLQDNTDDDALGITPIPVPEKKPTFLQRLFGRRDTTAKKPENKPPSIDTAGKTKKQIRQLKRELKREEKAQNKALKDAGLL